MKNDFMFLSLTRIAIVLVLVVIALGAYTRLSDAGLGCPDWPGCYGRLIVPAGTGGTEQANQIYPERPLEHGKAWKEMVHRYAAGGLGLVILALAALAWRGRGKPGASQGIALFLLGLVVFQALLGMWTVTLLLKPVIVLAHLLGGMTILLLLVWILLKQHYPAAVHKQSPGRVYPYALAGLVIVYLQISLGGWTSANYAAIVCPDLPTCQGSWWPPMDFGEGFEPWRGLGINYEYGVLATDARTAIHVSHRIGAVITLLSVLGIGVLAVRDPSARVRKTGTLLLALVLTQFSLGIANIVFLVPIGTAVAHNTVAALLLSCMGALLFHTKHTPNGRRAT